MIFYFPKLCRLWVCVLTNNIQCFQRLKQVSVKINFFLLNHDLLDNEGLSSGVTAALIILGILVVAAVVVGVLVRVHRQRRNVFFHQPKDTPLFELDENDDDDRSLQSELL